MSKADKMRTPELATAVLVVRGAVRDVLGPHTLATFLFNSKTKGRVTIVHSGEAPTDAVLAKVEKAANDARRHALPVHIKQQPRADAEAKYGATLYDKLRPPADVQQLNVALIGDDAKPWLVAAVKDGAFLSSTKELAVIKVPRANHRPQKEELEFCFELGDEQGDGGEAPEATAAEVKEKEQREPHLEAPVVATADKAPAPAPVSAGGVSLAAWAGRFDANLVAAFEAEGIGADVARRVVERLQSEQLALVHGLHSSAYAAGMRAHLKH